MAHVGLHTHRFRDNPEERRFAEAWQAMNAGAMLDWLLTPPASQPGDGLPWIAGARAEEVAATVIQWLGSPVGQGFLRDMGYEKKAEINNL